MFGEGLVLMRRASEGVVIDLRQWGLGLVSVGVIDIPQANRCRLHFDGDRRIPIHRSEVFEAIEREKTA